LPSFAVKRGGEPVEWSQFERGCQYLLEGLKAWEMAFSSCADSTVTNSGGTSDQNNQWKSSQYHLTASLHLGVSDASCHLGNFDDCQAFLDPVLYQIKKRRRRQSSSLLEKVHATAIQIRVLTRLSRYEAAAALDINVLQVLDETLRPHHDLKATKKILENCLRWPFGNVHVSSISDRTMLKDTKCLAAMMILNLLVVPLMRTNNRDLFRSIAYSMVTISRVSFALAAALFPSDGDVGNGSLCEETRVVKSGSCWGTKEAKDDVS
jgi:predicted ATPase